MFVKQFGSILMLDENRNKRVLWLCNHNTLMDFEVPLLISLGYEVFVPKLVPLDVIKYSGKVTFEYDNTLSIYADVLELLNSFNFYEDRYTPRICNILNQYFSTAFVVFIKHPLKNLTKYFLGNLYYRIFGLDGKRSYSNLLNDWDVDYERDNLYFAECYPFLHEVEDQELIDKKVYLPLGLNTTKYQQFKGNGSTFEISKDILFVCPRIDAQSYYNKQYKKFISEFKQFSYTVAGNNPINFGGDENIIGFLNDDEFLELFQSHKVLFYHSTEPRHLHYHPLEAMIIGMPVIFMNGGILSRVLNTDAKLPGCCDSYNEARSKIHKICNNDKNFITAILESQTRFLYEFSQEFCSKVWLKHFKPNAMIGANLVPQRKIGIILSNSYSGGILTQAKNIIKMLLKQINNCELNIKLELAFPQNKYYSSEEFDDLKLLGVTIRDFIWNTISASQAITIAKLYIDEFELPASPTGNYCYLDDKVASFTDLDYWLFLSDRMPETLLPLRNYSIIGYDYLQRYFNFIPPQLQEIIVSNLRNADCVFSTSPQSFNDAISYIGLPIYKVKMLPMEFSLYETKILDAPMVKPYFIWVTNTSIHKNHVNIGKAFAYYYNELNGKLKCVISGFNSNVLSPELKLKDKDISPVKHIKKFRAIITNENVCDKLKFVGYSSNVEYVRILQQASFTLHGNSYDNGSFSVIEAAYFGVPSVSTQYPAMEYINQRFNLNLLFCDANDYKDIAAKIKEMETNLLNYKNKLPSKDYLSKYNWENVSTEYFSSLMECIVL